ncbi:MAG: DUF6973 domain-containing protein [Paludibacteraceae bacterium]
MSNLKHISLLIVALALCFASCRTQQQALKPMVATQKTADTTVIPLLPAEAIYIIGQEFLAIHDSASAKYHTPRAAQVRRDSTTMAQYLDQRLAELYPDRAYPGYVAKVSRWAEMLIRREMPASATIRSYIGAELPHAANAAEAAALELTPEEKTTLTLLNTLATQASFADRTTLDTLHTDSFEEENLALTVMLWYGPRMYYRVMQSKARAEHLARHYYGENTNSGKRGDAFKHIYVNTLLRRYTGRLMSWLVMDVYWENANPNAPCDHFMDLHNNQIGRNSHYHIFTQPTGDTPTVSRAEKEVRSPGRTKRKCPGASRQVGAEKSPFKGDLEGLPSWQQAAVRIYRFIEDTTANSTFQPWDKQTPSFIVKKDEQQSPAQQYIYWNKEE